MPIANKKNPEQLYVNWYEHYSYIQISISVITREAFQNRIFNLTHVVYAVPCYFVDNDNNENITPELDERSSYQPSLETLPDIGTPLDGNSLISEIARSEDTSLMLYDDSVFCQSNNNVIDHQYSQSDQNHQTSSNNPWSHNMTHAYIDIRSGSRTTPRSSSVHTHHNSQFMASHALNFSRQSMIGPPNSSQLFSGSVASPPVCISGARSIGSVSSMDYASNREMQSHIEHPVSSSRYYNTEMPVEENVVSGVNFHEHLTNREIERGANGRRDLQQHDTNPQSDIELAKNIHVQAIGLTHEDQQPNTKHRSSDQVYKYEEVLECNYSCGVQNVEDHSQVTAENLFSNREPTTTSLNTLIVAQESQNHESHTDTTLCIGPAIPNSNFQNNADFRDHLFQHYTRPPENRETYQTIVDYARSKGYTTDQVEKAIEYCCSEEGKTEITRRDILSVLRKVEPTEEDSDSD